MTSPPVPHDRAQTAAADTSVLDRCDLRGRVQLAVDDLMAHQHEVLAEVSSELDPLLDAVASLLAGGKRLRAAFLYWGYRAAGHPDSDALVRLATSMELFQAAALLHDDVMDASDTRRGRPSAHRAFAAQHAQAGWAGESGRFGESGAILAGDLCLQWSDEAYSTSGIPAPHLTRGRPVFDVMRTQLMGGQYLDLLESARGWDNLGHEQRVVAARNVIRYKSAKYTIEHPLLIGATAGGLAELALTRLSAYGLALGEAFQLRDDVLGVFGDPVATGKPAGDDLREGKRTVLVAIALERADADQGALMDKLLGRPDLDEGGVDQLRSVLSDTGAVDRVEELIHRLGRQAHAELAELDGPAGIEPEAYGVLRALVGTVITRTA